MEFYLNLIFRGNRLPVFFVVKACLGTEARKRGAPCQGPLSTGCCSTSAGIHRSLCILYMHVLSLRAVPAHRFLHLHSLSSTRSSGQVRGSGCCKSMMHRGRNQAMTSWHVSATFLSTFPRRALARPAISWQKGKMTGVARTKGRPELRRRRRAKRQARRHVRRPGVQLAILRTRLNAASGGAQEHA